MSQVDQFESIFRSSIKNIYCYEDIAVKKILMITDMAVKTSEDLLEQTKSFLSVLEMGKYPKWELITGRDFKTTSDIIKLVKKHKPDLICTYRNLHSEAWKYPHSLGEHLDVLIQLTDIPVLILPHPIAGKADSHAFENTDTVMVLTDHLSADHRLVNYGIKFTEKRGALKLVHLEDTQAFNRVIDAISKIPSIDTDLAREKISEQLLKEPKDYIDSCTDILKAHDIGVRVQSVIRFGHHVTEFQKQIDKKKIDILIMHGKDDAQLAMHGVAYPLAVEIRQIPLLII